MNIWDTDEKWMTLAFAAAAQSLDDTTQVGACLVGTSGFHLTDSNRPPDRCGANGDEIKRWTIHAEQNVLHACTYTVLSPASGTMYCTWAACRHCALAIVKCHVKRVVIDHDLFGLTPARWQDRVNEGLEVLDRGGVKVEFFRGEYGVHFQRELEPIRFDGGLYYPTRRYVRTSRHVAEQGHETVTVRSGV